MASKPALEIVTPPSPGPLTDPTSQSVNRRQSHRMSQLKQDALDEKMASTTSITDTGSENRHADDDRDDNEDMSNYGDNSDDEKDIAGASALRRSFPISKFTDSRRSREMASPGLYAEFTANPYEKQEIPRAIPNSTELDRDHFSPPRTSSSSPISGYPLEDPKEMQAKLLSNLNSAYEAIKSEELASLRFLQNLTLDSPTSNQERS
ncbi:hypothetical protein M426DRAFT_269043 [Hypoxylon sp. CI-4A]|nr:hypothetical protein M426DRAFT_269043 [Hypoxylon sp. CI-4A]